MYRNFKKLFYFSYCHVVLAKFISNARQKFKTATSIFTSISAFSLVLQLFYEIEENM